MMKTEQTVPTETQMPVVVMQKVITKVVPWAKA